MDSTRWNRIALNIFKFKTLVICVQIDKIWKCPSLFCTNSGKHKMQLHKYIQLGNWAAYKAKEEKNYQIIETYHWYPINKWLNSCPWTPGKLPFQTYCLVYTNTDICNVQWTLFICQEFETEFLLLLQLGSEKGEMWFLTDKFLSYDLLND